MSERQVAIRAAREAGRYLRQAFFTLSSHDVKQKSRFESVTTADKKAGEMITRILRRAFPEYGVINEEAPTISPSAAATWVIDPIDGTTNFITHNPYFALAIGLIKNGIPTLGVIYWPEFNELFVGELGKGALLNDETIHVARERRLDHSIISLGYTHTRKSIEGSTAIYRRARFAVSNMRHAGSTCLDLAFVAAGRLEAAIQVGPIRLWDVAAGIPIIQEAGGIISDFRGRAFTDKSRDFLASNGKIHNALLKKIT
jgi:myo-inositol-1(or 4)-monophosphatase